MSLLQLSNELLLCVARFLDTQRDINALTQVNRRLYALTNHLLYQYNVQHHGSSAMLWAAERGSAETMQKLLDEGAICTVQVPTPRKKKRKVFRSLHEETPLSLAVKKGHVAVIRLLLDHGADLLWRDVHGHTPLEAAVRETHEAVVEFLLSELEKRDSSTISAHINRALATAATFGCDSMARLLLDKGADVNSPAEQHPESTPLTLAASHGHVNLVQLLLDHGADVRFALDGALESGSTRVVQLLLSRGADINSVRTNPLNGANLAMLQLLHDVGCDFGRYGPEALFTAIEDIEDGREKTVEYLIQNGADPKARDHTHHTTINAAVREDNLAIVKLLIAKGVHPDSEDLRIAKARGNADIISLLEQFPCPEPPPRPAPGQGQPPLWTMVTCDLHDVDSES